MSHISFRTYYPCFLALCLLIISPALALASSVTFINKFASPYDSTIISAFEFGDYTYVNTEEFTTAVGIGIYREQMKNKLVLYLPQRQIRLSADNHFVVNGEQVLNLPVPVKVKDQILYIPIQPFLPLLEEALQGLLIFTGDEIIFMREGYNILGLASSYYQGKVNLDILTNEKLEYTVDKVRAREIVINFPGSLANYKELTTMPTPQGLKAVECARQEWGCQFTFKLQSNTNLDTVFLNEHPLSVRLVISGLSTDEEINNSLKSFRQGQRFDTIVIDPGHGGKDPGALGKDGLKEKDVVLDIGLRLEKLLTDAGYKVVLTRRTDEFIPLYERGKIANSAGGKLFVSIHVNANRDSRANGVETYFLSPAQTDEAMEVARLENASVDYETDKSYYENLENEDFILLTMSKSNEMKESEMLAGYIQETYKVQSGQKNRGVDQAGFYVLYGANMPAVLVEAGFITNKREEKLMKTKKYRQETALMIAESIKKFCQAKEQERL